MQPLLVKSCHSPSNRLSATEVLTEDDVSLIERFVILLYDVTSSVSDINTCRRELFTRKGRSVENIPPTKDALSQHIRRAMLQNMQVFISNSDCLLESISFYHLFSVVARQNDLVEHSA